MNRPVNLHRIFYISIISFIYLGCASAENETREDMRSYEVERVKDDVRQSIITGAERLGVYVPKLDGKKVGLVVNHTSQIDGKHLVDSLLELDVNIVRIFAPEHGFRGKADAGDQIKDGKDERTGIPIVSLYGKKKAPEEDDLNDLDVVIYDIQDVGVRFYTYISTMHHVMESCARFQKRLIVLDRPNPNGHYIDGPVLKPEFQSFVGMHQIPVVYGLTCGELAQMINGEQWLENGLSCQLEVIPCINYTHGTTYALPIKPSPNLPNLRSIYLYPSLCFFEATKASIGRGTNKQFQIIGYPNEALGAFSFTPEPMEGAQNPKLKGVSCYGIDLTTMDPAQIKEWGRINLEYLVRFMEELGDPEFINRPDFFDKLAGTDELRKQLMNGMSPEAIREGWKDELVQFAERREPYLLYD